MWDKETSRKFHSGPITLPLLHSAGRKKKDVVAGWIRRFSITPPILRLI